MPHPLMESLQEYIGQPLPPGAPPFSRGLNGTLQVLSARFVKLRYTIARNWTTPTQTLHTAMMAALLDDAMSMIATLAGNGEEYAPLEMHVQYLKTAEVGQDVVVTARVTEEIGSVARVEGELTSGFGTRLAIAHAFFVPLDVPGPSSESRS